MERISLKLEGREPKKPNQLRRVGQIPATVYGPETKAASFQVSRETFSRLPGAAYSQVIDLETPQGAIKALIRKVQRKHVSSEILNIEFYQVASTRKLTVTVPLKFNGISPAIAKGGLLVEMHLTAILECLPSDIPEYIDVDITKIEEIDHGIHFSELSTAPGVKILNPAEELVARVVPKKGGAVTAAPAAEKKK